MGAYVNRQPVGAVACISPYNFPLTNMVGQDRARARGRLHRRDEAGAAGPARDRRARRGAARGRVPARRRQPRHVGGTRPGGRAVVEPRHRHGVVHRLHRDRREDLRGRRAHDEAHAARARRQGRGARARRRQHHRRGHRDRQRVGLPQRPDLHRADVRDRAPQQVRRAGRQARGRGRRAEGRRPARHRHHRRPGDLGGAARPHRGVRRRRWRRRRRHRRRRSSPEPHGARLLRRTHAARRAARPT